MLNIFYADLYRLIKQKCGWILLIIAAAVFLFTGASMGIMTGNAPFVVNMQNSFRETLRLYEESGMDISAFEQTLSLSEQIRFATRFEFIGQLLTFDMMIFITIFTGLFVLAEKNSGFVYCLAALTSRKDRFLSKALILLLYCIVLTAAVVLTLVPVSFIFYRDLPFGSPMPFILYIVLKTLLVYVFSLIVLLLSDVMKKSMRAVVFSMIYLLIGCGVIYNLIDSLFSKSGFCIEYCTPIGSMGLITLGDYKTYLGAAIVIVIWAAVVFIEEIFFVSKRDLI